MMIVLDNREIAYDAVNEYVKEYWNKHGWDDAIVQMETSYDGLIWDKHREVVTFISDKSNARWLWNWWQGEKYIKILSIVNISELNIEREHYNAIN